MSSLGCFFCSGAVPSCRSCSSFLLSHLESCPLVHITITKAKAQKARSNEQASGGEMQWISVHHSAKTPFCPKIFIALKGQGKRAKAILKCTLKNTQPRTSDAIRGPLYFTQAYTCDRGLYIYQECQIFQGAHLMSSSCLAAEQTKKTKNHIKIKTPTPFLNKHICKQSGHTAL